MLCSNSQSRRLSSMILTNAALPSTGLLITKEIPGLETRSSSHSCNAPHMRKYAKLVSEFLTPSVRSTSFRLEFGPFRFPLMMVIVLHCGRLSPAFRTSSAHQLLSSLLFSLLLFLRTLKQPLDLQQDVQRGVPFLDTFDCPIHNADIGSL